MHDTSSTLADDARDEDLGLAVRASRREWLTGRLAGAPLVPPAAGMVLGIVFDSAFSIPLWIAIPLFCAAGACLCARTSALVRHAAIGLAAVTVGALLHDVNFRHWPETHIVRYCDARARPARVTGVVVTAPVIRVDPAGRYGWKEQAVRSSFVLQAERIEGISGDIPASGLVSVQVRAAVSLSAGDRIEAFGIMQRLRGPTNPGAMEWALVQRRRGILVQMTCEHAENLERRAGGGWASRLMSRCRRSATAALLEGTFPEDAPGSQVLEALVLGQRSAITQEVTDAFVRTGTVHYLSVSGSHVAMLAGFIWGIGVLAGRSRRQCALWALVIVVIYSVLAEPNAPIIRSAIMGSLLCVATLLRLPFRTANWLAGSALLLLAIGPMQLFDAGFQLSFGTLIGLIYLSPRVYALGRRITDIVLRRNDPLLQPEIQRMLNPPGPVMARVHYCTHIFGLWCAVGVSAWAVGSLISAYHFQQFSLWGWLNTILIMPIVSVVLVLGLGKAVLTAVWQPLGALLGPVLGWCTDLLIAFVQLLARLPVSGWPTPAVPLGVVAAGLFLLMLWAMSPWLRLKSRYLLVMAGVCVLASGWVLRPVPPGGVTLTVLSVGNGACSAIRLPNGRTMICDMGSRPPYDIERFVLRPFLAQEHLWGVDQVILTHSDMDHVVAAADLLERRRVGSVAVSPHYNRMAGRRGAARDVLDEAAGRGVRVDAVSRGGRLDGCLGVTVDVLWPPESGRLSANDSSLVLRLSYAGRRILMCGDIQEIPQRRLIETEDLKADVLLLPHHGGVVPATGEFLRAVNPEICIRSTGQADRETRNGVLRLVEGRRYFNTDDDGAVRVRITKSGKLDVHSWRSRDGS